MKTAVIVGAGKGMGNHIAERFAREGFRLVLVARRKEAVEEYAREFSSRGYEAYGEVADVSKIETLTEVFNRIQNQFGAIDVLIYNAALMEGGDASKLTAEDAIRHFQIDVAGAIHCVSRVLPKQIMQGDGAIIFTGGLFGVHPNANSSFACMSMDKSALRSLALMLNSELKSKGIFVGIVQIMGVVGSSEQLSPSKIAEEYWNLYESRRDFEVFCE